MRRLGMLTGATILALQGGGVAAPPGAADEVTATANMRAVARIPYTGGTDLELTTIKGRRYVVAGAQNNYNPDPKKAGVRVVDVTNPAKPRVAGFLPCNTSQNDIQVKGTLAFVGVDFNVRGETLPGDCFAQAPVTGGVAVIDLSTPTRPRVIGVAKVKDAAHNVTVHPTKPYLYVSDGEITTRESVVHVVDIRNPRAPKTVADVSFGPGTSSHDVTFNRSGTRAYMASGFTHTAILDTSDPTKPREISRIYDPAINYQHQADPTPDGKYLLITDELAGAEGNLSCPGGGIHVWDISVESRPVKVGAYFIPEAFASAEEGPRPVDPLVPAKLFRCTAHVMRITPDGKTLVMGWYSQGIQVLDIGNLGPGVSAGAASNEPGMPIRRIGAWKVAKGDTWSAKMDDRGFIYTGDTQRGMDIVRFTRPSAATPVSPGVWLTPAEALARGTADKARESARGYLCFDIAGRLSG